MVRQSDKKCILAVDDAATILLRITDTLDKYYNVVTVNSGARALRYLEKVKPDLILLDIRMEGITLGISDYILKPFAPDDLLFRIRRVLEPEKLDPEQLRRFEGSGE